MKLSKNTTILGIETFSKSQILLFVQRVFRSRKKKEEELLAVMKSQKPKRAWEYWAKTGATHIQLSDGTIKELPKKPVKQ